VRVAVVGAGKMGLPLICQFAQRGAEVTAADVNAEMVGAINRGECPFDEPGLSELLVDGVAARRIRATTDTREAVGESDAVVVIVPALLTPERRIDTSHLVEATGAIAAGLRRGALVSFETTVPVGTTRHRLGPMLAAGGLEPGRDFALVFSPERVKSRFVLKHLAETPKVVGGLRPECARRGEDFYRRYLGAPVINVGSLEAAELVKLAGMVYRDVNIALANELARYAEALGLDLGPVIEAANTDGEAYLLTPGIGVGGHCTPVYPYFMIHDATERGAPVTLAERARRVNDGQAAHAAALLEAALGGLHGRHVLVLGLGFRPEVKEHSYSTTFLLVPELAARGAAVAVHDPLYTADELRRFGLVPGGLDGVPGFDALVLSTAHGVYRAIDWGTLAARGLRAVLDGRGLWEPARVEAFGVRYIGVGRPLPAAITERPRRVPVARPLLGGAEAEAAAEVVRSGWVMQGPQVAAFERELGAYLGAPHVCAVSSGTAALHLALLAVGVGPGDEVITVSHSFIASANSVRYCGARPVFVDIDPRTLNIDPRAVEAAVTERTRAVLCVHQVGMPCDVAALAATARRHALVLVEDAACAIGSEILWQGRWEKIGRPHGDIACFSFHPRKVLTTGDGGVVATANPDWDRFVRLAREHGMSVPGVERHATDRVVFESYPMLGYNYRMTDLQAVLGREQLRRLDAAIAERRGLVDRYRALLAPLPVTIPLEPAWAHSNWQSLCVRLPERSDQRGVMQAMLDGGVVTRRGVMCAHRERAYVEAYGAQSLPESERAQDEMIVLPLFPGMTEAEQERVVRALEAALGHR
jgi:perosamine synthetase